MVDKTISEQIIRESPEVEALKLGLIESAKDLADISIKLPQQKIADFSALQKAAQALGQAPGGIGGYQPYLTKGAGTLDTALGTLGQAVSPIVSAQEAAGAGAQMFSPSDLTSFTNPFQQAVIDQTLADLERQGDLAKSKLAADAVGGGAFGGSRFGIQGAELDRNLADVKARTIAQLNAQNYAQALAAAQASFENQQKRQQNQSSLMGGIASLYGGLAGQQAGIAGQQFGLGQLAQTSGMKDIATLQQLGQEQQQLQQSVLNAQQANQQRQLYEPYSRVAFLSDIYKGAPSTQQTLGSQVAPSPASPSAFQQVAGIGTGLLGTAAAASKLNGLFV